MSKYTWLTVTDNNSAACKACAHLTSFKVNAGKRIYIYIPFEWRNAEFVALKKSKNSKFYLRIFAIFIND
jgi:hypothetical protein